MKSILALMLSVFIGNISLAEVAPACGTPAGRFSTACINQNLTSVTCNGFVWLNDGTKPGATLTVRDHRNGYGSFHIALHDGRPFEQANGYGPVVNNSAGIKVSGRSSDNYPSEGIVGRIVDGPEAGKLVGRWEYAYSAHGIFNQCWPH